MDKTNYPLLSIVAVVAITAIVAIFLTHADEITPLNEGATIVANAVLDVPITGMVASEPAAPPRPARTLHRFDFSQDGTLNTPDADKLALVIDRVEFCPRSTQCDVNGDNFVDIQDLGALNAILLKEAAQQAPQPVYAPAQPRTYEPSTDHSLAIGTFGAIA
jgi:hypothetical protein